jgi:transposase
MCQAAGPYHLFVGSDVAADTCAVAARRAPTPPVPDVTVAPTPAGFADLQQQLLALEPDPAAILVVMEATGTSWMHLALQLVAANIAVAVVNPAHAHDGAKARLQRTKTDAIDVGTLAEVAARLQPQPLPIATPLSGEGD